jgi:hypothetical protein
MYPIAAGLAPRMFIINSGEKAVTTTEAILEKKLTTPTTHIALGNPQMILAFFESVGDFLPLI